MSDYRYSSPGVSIFDNLDAWRKFLLASVYSHLDHRSAWEESGADEALQLLDEVYHWILTVTASGGGGGGAMDYVHVQDQKAQNTNGGTFTAGDWRQRDLQTIVADTAGIASVAGNQVTLPAGSYKVTGRGLAFLVNGHQLRVYDVTHSAVLAIGLDARSSSADGSGTLATAGGYFTLTETANIQLQHRCGTTRANTGFGQPNNWGVEVYSEIEFWRFPAA